MRGGREWDAGDFVWKAVGREGGTVSNSFPSPRKSWRKMGLVRGRDWGTGARLEEELEEGKPDGSEG